MSAHMKAMMRVKEKIPKEYQIMDRTPVTPTPRSLARGEEVFFKNCAVCHGEKGDGLGPAAAGMDPAPANFLDLDHSATYGPGEKYWLIGNGSEATGMPAFPQLSPADRWHAVNHILFLQMKGKAGNDDMRP